MSCRTLAACCPLQMVFALNALGLSVWFPRIPDVKEALGLDVLTLAFCLFGMPAGTMLGFLSVAAADPAASGRGRPCIWGGSGFLLSFIVPALAPNALALALALFVCGLTIATIEVSMNAKASQTERVLGRRIMTRCHAFWSFGTVAGALIGGGFAQAGVGFLDPAAGAAADLRGGDDLLRAAAASPTSRQRRGERRAGASRCRRRRCSLLCLVPIGALLIEGAMMEWSALLMREWKGAGPFVTAVTFSVFALAMAVAG